VHIVGGEYPVKRGLTLGHEPVGVTTLCPGGKERMRRLMSMIENGRVDLSPLITHRFALDDIQDAFELLSRQGDGVLKVALFRNRGSAVAPAPSAAETVAGRA
jgi:hypothetical protein